MNKLIETQQINNEILNPFNRNQMPLTKINEFKRMNLLGKILKRPIKTNICIEITTPKDALTRCRELCMEIDRHGYYTNEQWFLSMGETVLRLFVYELRDIWEYRSNSTRTIRQCIVPGVDPFTRLNGGGLRHCTYSELQHEMLYICEKLVTSGTTNDYKGLGAIYVTLALTMFNIEAAENNQWLYESAILV